MMDDYISRQKILDEAQRIRRNLQMLDNTQAADKMMHGLRLLEKAIEDQPTAPVREVKRGRWIWDDEGYHCSECFFHAYGNALECMDGTYRFCPHCGADMREES